MKFFVSLGVQAFAAWPRWMRAWPGGIVISVVAEQMVLVEAVCIVSCRQCTRYRTLMLWQSLCVLLRNGSMDPRPHEQGCGGGRDWRVDEGLEEGPVGRGRAWAQSGKLLRRRQARVESTTSGPVQDNGRTSRVRVFFSFGLACVGTSQASSGAARRAALLGPWDFGPN